MTRASPPLECIEAFVEAARTGSFRRAAEQLALSPSAFSRRIANLERFLRAPLFERGPARVCLTAAGHHYLRAAQGAMDALCRATLDFRLQEVSGALRVRAPHSFTINWLLPRISSFLDANPDIDMTLTTGRGLDELRAGRVDALIAVGPTDLGGYPSEKLIELEAAVVAAPALLRGAKPPRAPRDLLNHRILSVPQAPELWTQWLERAGEPVRPPPGIQYETLIMMYEAAAAGLGVALGLPLFTEPYFASGRLRACFPLRLPIGHCYSLVFASEAIGRRPDMRRFSAYLHEQIDQSQRAFASAVERSGAPASPVRRREIPQCKLA